MRTAAILVLVISLLACSEFDAKAMFAQHAAPIESSGVKGLRGGKVACLHCPMYFTFESTPALVEQIISTQKLRQVDALPQPAKQLEELVKHEASWWLSASPNSQDKVYWVHYRPKSPGLEPASRLLVLKGNQAFFITSGHFSSEHYVPDNA